MNTEINTLIKGYQKFHEQYYQKKSMLYDTLTRYGQKPKFLIIACSDSRVDPAIVTNAEPGDLFVIRNVANLVPPYEKNINDEEDTTSYHGVSAALEFGVCELEVQHIIVFGHSQCGGIGSLFQEHNVTNHQKKFINKWMELACNAHAGTIKQYAQAPLEEQISTCAHYSLINSLQNLKTFPWIKSRVQNNALFLHSWYFDLATGIIDIYDEKNNIFETLRFNELT